MLTKEYRLDPKDIPDIARRGKRLTSEMFDIRCWWDNNLEYPKFALAVGLKVSKSAVIRNSIKRKFRAAIHNMLADQDIKKGKYLIVAKNDALNDLKSNEIEQILMTLLA